LGQEFTIKSENIESKINQLLPTQGGYGAGVDFSASSMIVPIIDLTETAEGSGLRQDLQTSFSLNTVSSFSINNASSTLVNTTGYFRVFGNIALENRSTADGIANFQLTDGTTTKIIYELRISPDASKVGLTSNFDFIVFLPAGNSLIGQSGHTTCNIIGCTRQIADINGNLTNPI
jgi:hypothetical protein